MADRRTKSICIGDHVGELNVVMDSGERKSGYTVWECKCTCGNIVKLDTRTLQRGSRTDCGCRTKVNPGQKNLTGQRFGRLVAVEPLKKRSKTGAVIWRCQCDCGGSIEAPLTQLTQGYRKSCGCLSRPNIKDYIGRQFGSLTVTEYAGKKEGMHRWHCLCQCGSTTIVGQTLLQSGKTKSCGCLQAKSAVTNMKFVEGTSVTILENAKNRLIRNNTSGHNGVYYNQRSDKWIAQIGFKGKNYYLGTFEKIEDAVRARELAEERIYGEFLDWYYENHPKSKKEK